MYFYNLRNIGNNFKDQIKFLSLSLKKEKHFVNIAHYNLLASFGFVECLMGS